MAVIKNEWASEYTCLTTDTPPTVNIPDGSILNKLNFTTKTSDSFWKFHNGEWYKL